MKRFTIFIFLVLAALTSKASLTAVVTPGYQFPTDGSVTITYDLLNELATPTIQILGTIGGSNTLSPGSITGTSMNDNFVDGVTITYNSSSPRQIQVNPHSVGTNQVNTNLWNWPVVQSNNAASIYFIYNHGIFKTNSLGLDFLYDTNFFTTNGVGLTKTGPTNTFSFMQTNGAATNVFLGPLFAVDTENNTVVGETQNGPTLTLPTFTTVELPLSNNVAYYFTTNHALGAIPLFVRWVVVCKTTELGYSVGDEIDANALVGSTFDRKSTEGANSTDIFFAIGMGGEVLQLPNKTSPGTAQNLAALNNQITNWKLKGYARR